MTLFILTETSAGYALFKARDKKLLKRDDVGSQDAAGLSELVKLKKFEKFDSATTALEEVSALIDGKVTSKLSSLLDSIKDEKKASLAVADPKLGNAINKIPHLSIAPISDSSTQDIYRSIRNHLPSLIPGLLPDDISAMSLGLSHSLSRHKLKFSPDKIDTMIIQAIAIMDDLDKELNQYAMRVKEWYGWHFPEMAKIINDNLAYARCILEMGYRSDAKDADLSKILPEEIETAVKAAAEVSMGTEISEDDLICTKGLAEQVVQFTELRQELSSYLTTRMQAIAPNLTTLVGELVGARLIAHAGSLVQLAKSPASTIQILGAEKALFRALKTKHDTPKYGLIYHASLVGQATGKNKGKIARLLATKAALGLRIDSLSDWGTAGEGDKVEPTDEEKAAHGNESRIKIERRLRSLEGRPLGPKGVAIAPSGQLAQPNRFELKEARKYNPDADGLALREAAQEDTPAKDSNLIQEINGGASESESEEDTEMVNGLTNGVSKDKSSSKAEKAARKAERAAKRERKLAKKAAKEEKLRAKEMKAADEDSKKKRKREETEGGDEKKKKKKKKEHAT